MNHNNWHQFTCSLELYYSVGCTTILTRRVTNPAGPIWAACDTSWEAPRYKSKSFPKKGKPLASEQGEPSEGHVAREILSSAGEEPLFNLPDVSYYAMLLSCDTRETWDRSYTKTNKEWAELLEQFQVQ